MLIALLFWLLVLGLYVSFRQALAETNRRTNRARPYKAVMKKPRHAWGSAPRASHFYRAKFILNFAVNSEQSCRGIRNDADSDLEKMGK